MATKQFVTRGGVRVLGTLGDGSGDEMLTRDSSTKDVAAVPSVDSVNFISSSLQSGRILIGNSSNIAQARLMSGMVTMTNTGVASITAGSITNTHVSGAAAIAYTKLNLTNQIRNADILTTAAIARTKFASGTAYRLVINNASGVMSDANAITANRLLISDVNGIPTHSTVTNTEAAYLSGVTSNIQTQFSNKLSFSSLITPVEGDLLQFTGGSWNVLNVGAAGEVLISDGTNVEWGPSTANGLPAGGTANQYLAKVDGTNYNVAWNTLSVSKITDLTASAAELNILDGATLTVTELNYVDGVTSNIQTQLGAKLDRSLPYNCFFIGNASNVPISFPPGADGEILTTVAGIPSWEAPTAAGDVSGPLSSTDNAVVRWNGVLGDSIQDSNVIIDDSDAITGVTALTIQNAGTISLYDAGDAAAISIQAESGGSGYTILLPQVAPVDGDVLSFNSGNYIWAPPSGLADGDYGDITLSSSATVWTIDTNINKAWTGLHTFAQDIVVGGDTTYGSNAINVTGSLTTIATGAIAVAGTTYSHTFTGTSAVWNVSSNNNSADTVALNILGSGAGHTTGKHLTIIGNAAHSGSNANGGNITIRSGQRDGTGQHGNITIQTGLTWNFSIDAVEGFNFLFDTNGTGDMYYRKANTYTGRLPIGTSGQVLTVSSGLPAWVTPSTPIPDGDKGDITVSSTGTVWTIDNDVVTYAKMQNVSATNRFLGRITSGAGDTEELTGTQATTLLDVFTTSLKGVAPASGGGTTNFLRADGTWAAPSGSIGGSIASTQVAYGSGSNTIAGEAAFTYNATDNILTVDRFHATAQSSAPAATVTNGDLYYNSTGLDFQARVNSQWINLTRPEIIVTSSTSITLDESYRNKVVYCTSSSPITVSGGNISVGFSVTVVKSGTGNVTFSPTGGTSLQSIDDEISTQYGWATFIQQSSSVWTGTGALGAITALADGDKGDITVTASGATWTIDNDVVTYAKMQNMTTARILGRTTASSGDVEELTVDNGLTLASGGVKLGGALTATTTLSGAFAFNLTTGDTTSGAFNVVPTVSFGASGYAMSIGPTANIGSTSSGLLFGNTQTYNSGSGTYAIMRMANTIALGGQSGTALYGIHYNPTISGSGTNTHYAAVFASGRVGIGTVTPTAMLHLPAGTATANTAPLKLVTGTALTTPEDGAIEYHGSHLYFTIGSTRYQLDQQGAGGGISGLTSGRVPYATSSTTIADEAGFEYSAASNVLTVENITLGIAAAAGSSRTIGVGGSATDIDLALNAKGAGSVILNGTTDIDFTTGGTWINNVTNDMPIILGDNDNGIIRIKSDFLIQPNAVTGSVELTMDFETDMVIVGADGNVTNTSAHDILIYGGEAYQTSGNGNGGNIVLTSGLRRAAGSGVDGNIVLDSGTGGKIMLSKTPTTSTDTADQVLVRDVTDGELKKLTLGAGITIQSGALVSTKNIVVAASDETTALTTGTSKITFRMPHAMTVTAVRASLSTAQTSGSIFTVDINEAGSTILSTKLTIDNTEKTSTTAATAAVISDTALADDAEITIDIDQVGDGTAKGLKVYIIGY